jgi:hypothetical protein
MMTVWIRILIATATIAFALWILFDARESNFQPYWSVRIKLWFAGFLATWAIGWAYTGGGFADAIWLKILISIIGGLLWSVRLVGFLQVSSSNSEQVDSEDP